MKTKDLINLSEKNGWKFKRHGGSHDIYERGLSYYFNARVRNSIPPIVGFLSGFFCRHGIRGNTLCISRISGFACGKICRKDDDWRILNRL